jgi:hypothetical protein
MRNFHSMRCVPKIMAGQDACLFEIRGPIFAPVVGSVNQTKLAVNLSED